VHAKEDPHLATLPTLWMRGAASARLQAKLETLESVEDGRLKLQDFTARIVVVPSHGAPTSPLTIVVMTISW
jgi:hypothetical protein